MESKSLHALEHGTPGEKCRAAEDLARHRPLEAGAFEALVDALGGRARSSNRGLAQEARPGGAEHGRASTAGRG
jgi:hypothetical protein